MSQQYQTGQSGHSGQLTQSTGGHGQQSQRQTGPRQGQQRQQQTQQGQQPQHGQLGQQKLFPTRSYVPEQAREEVVKRLNRELADTTILMTHAKFAHWNVKGMEFWGLHELFDELAEVLETHVDMIAERITALGGQAMGTAGMAVSNCGIPQMPTNAVSGREFVELLADRLAIHDANLYEDIETADSFGDPDTADLLNEVSREVSQYQWFLEAHLQPSGGSGQGQSQGSYQQY